MSSPRQWMKKVEDKIGRKFSREERDSIFIRIQAYDLHVLSSEDVIALIRSMIGGDISEGT